MGGYLRNVLTDDVVGPLDTESEEFRHLVARRQPQHANRPVYEQISSAQAARHGFIDPPPSPEEARAAADEKHDGGAVVEKSLAGVGAERQHIDAPDTDTDEEE